MKEKIKTEAYNLEKLQKIVKSGGLIEPLLPEKLEPKFVDKIQKIRCSQREYKWDRKYL